jgi:nitrate reductase gamma subunit
LVKKNLVGGISLDNKIKELCIISSLLAIAGLVLMFSSNYFGTTMGDSWLHDQAGVADTDQYNRVVDTYKNNFVIIGSILFGTGILTAILTYFISFLTVKNENRNIV